LSVSLEFPSTWVTAYRNQYSSTTWSNMAFFPIRFRFCPNPESWYSNTDLGKSRNPSFPVPSFSQTRNVVIQISNPETLFFKLCCKNLNTFAKITYKMLIFILCFQQCNILINKFVFLANTNKIWAS
jgi:hypothetical protein